MQKNELITVVIEDMTKDGEGIGHANGYTLFVKDAVIGDEARARITRPRKSYAYARVEEVLAPSPYRVSPRCPEARRCGGCRLQELSYERQLLFKHKLVSDALKRIGGFPNPEVRPVMGMAEPYRYRNKAQYPIGFKDGKAVAGFYAGRTHSLIEVEDCQLTHRVNGEILRTFLDYMNRFRIPPYEEATGRGLVRHLLIREGFTSGEILVCPVINGDRLPHAEQLTETLSRVPGIRSVCLNINKKKGNVILGDRTVPLLGDPWIEDQLGGLSFRISPRSFYQVNPAQTELLYEEVLRAASLTGRETVYDLYCGIGTISLYLARRARAVYGVEIVPDAIRDARENAARNGIRHAHFYVGAAEDLVASGEFEAGVPCPPPDVVVLDPPRKGCAPALIQAVRRLGPERIVYVSCDPATLARDLKFFADGTEVGYSYLPDYCQVVDMFPQTCHVETVCLLSKLSEAKNHISVKVNMDEMDVTAAESKATYDEIREWVQDNYGFRVTNLNIAQVKRKHGIIERENYNKPKSLDSKQPGCTEEKVKAIEAALHYFKMIYEVQECYSARGNIH